MHYPVRLGIIRATPAVVGWVCYVAHHFKLIHDMRTAFAAGYSVKEAGQLLITHIVTRLVFVIFVRVG
jgi:hypothetical protein